MTQETIRRSLFKVLRKSGIPKAKINENASLKEDLFWDELDLTCFLYHLETSFKIEVQPEEINKLYSISDTINFLRMRSA
ncbi:MAG: acyl carrier protein [Breznakibacter sp.]|jgi:acyl carrier protein|nr:acyl carrier protein [Breznakibacter sp.]